MNPNQPGAPRKAFDVDRALMVLGLVTILGLILLPVYCAYFWWIFTRLAR